MKLLSKYRRSYLTVFCSAELILVDTRVATEPKKASHHSLRFVSLLVCLLCQLLWKTRCARRTVDQSDGIYNSYSTVARDLWQRQPPLSSGCALGLGSVYCRINPWPRAITITYLITIVQARFNSFTKLPMILSKHTSLLPSALARGN